MPISTDTDRCVSSPIGVCRALLAVLAVAAPACGGSARQYPPPKYCVGAACDASADGPPVDADVAPAACLPAVASDAHAPLRVMRDTLGDTIGRGAMALALAAMWFCGLSSVTSASAGGGALTSKR